MQIFVVAYLFQLFLIVSLCLGRPGRSDKSGGSGIRSSAAFKSGHYGNSGNTEDAPTHKGRDKDDDEGENTYEYDDKGAGVYAKLDEIVYPFQQYIQVRHSYSVEHLPIKEEFDDEPHNSLNNAKSESSNSVPVTKSVFKKHPPKKRRGRKPKQKLNLETSASTRNENQNYNGDENDYEQNGEDDEDYESQSSYKDHKPRLKEEIEDYKKQEVYEERGYGDKAYDHEEYGARSHHTYRDRDRDDHPGYDDDNHDAQDQPSSSSTPKKSKSRPSSRTEESRRRPYYGKNPHPHPHLSELPTSTKLLEYAASNLYDKDAHEKGIYAARENIHCPEVIDFDLSSKKMGMGKGGKNPRGSKPRLTGLGDKIKCLKEKYFGAEPLPRQIFMEPAESRVAAIQIPTFDQFYKSVRDEVDSISEFQHF